jgi:hypothetical protein
MKIGLDNGYGQVKVVCADTREEKLFPSVVTRVDRALLGKEDTYFSYSDATGRYLVGDDALLHGQPTLPSVDSSYIERPEYRVQALYAIESVLAGHLKKGQQLPVDLVTGLPVEFFKAHRASLEKIVMSWENPRIRVNSVTVVPQPMGALMDLSGDWDGMIEFDFRGDKRVALVDVGHGTIDAIEIVDGKVSGNFQGRSVGVSRMYDELFSTLSQLKPDAGIERSEIPRIAREGQFIYFGEEIGIGKQLRDAKRRMAEVVASVVQEAWPSAAKLYRIVVTGGGAEALKDELPKVINPKQLLMPEKPAMSNARGFAKLAMVRKPKN